MLHPIIGTRFPPPIEVGEIGHLVIFDERIFMAITAPTPPTPPTAPVVPGARSSSADAGNADVPRQNSVVTNSGGDKGIHIDISYPEGMSNRQEQGNTGNEGTVGHTKAAPDKDRSAKQDSDGAAAVDKTARQDMSQQAIGIDDAATEQKQQEAIQEPWPLPGNNLGSMSYLPFFIVFVAAFITFMLKNMGKKSERKGGPVFPRERRRHSQDASDSNQGHIDINGKAAAKASSAEKGKKGSHFEMRI